MKLKKALVLGVSSLFLFAVACGDDGGEFFNGSTESSVATSEETSIEQSSEESSLISSEESSSSMTSSESSSTDPIGGEDPPVTTGDTGKLPSNLDTQKEFPNYTFRVSSAWKHLPEESQKVNDEIRQGYIEDGVDKDLTFLVDYYDVYGDPTVVDEDYFIVNYISIEYSEEIKSAVTLDSLMESMTPSYLVDYGEVESATVNGIEFKFVRGFEINTGDYSLFALASDGDNSYAGFTLVFTDGAANFYEALALFNLLINGIQFK